MAEQKENSDVLTQIEPYIARANAAWGDVALILGASLAVALLFFLVFRFVRRKDGNTISRTRELGRESSGSGSKSGSSSSSGGGFLGMGSKRHRRRRRRGAGGPSYEQRNPTRAEVGGLPPVRDTEEPPPPARATDPSQS